MQWLGTAFTLNRMLHMLALVIACGLWLVIFGFRFRRPQAGATVARLLIAWGVTCIVIGNTAAYTHAFVWIVLTPGIAVSTALLIEWLFHVTDQHRVAPVTGIGVALGVALFAAWTASTTFSRLYPTTPAAPFTPVEMGQAIKAAAPGPGDLALVVGGDGGPGSQLWFYADPKYVLLKSLQLQLVALTRGHRFGKRLPLSKPQRIHKIYPRDLAPESHVNYPPKVRVFS